MKKFSSELAYFLGIALLALGTALIVRADFGVSMVVAPAYLMHLKVSELLPFFSFGMAEYTFQAMLLVLMCLILRKFRAYYLFSFVTAVVYGFVLDLFTPLVSLLSAASLFPRIVEFAFGIFFSASAIALLFHSYIPPEVYELFVKEFSERFGFDLGRVKICYDLISCGAAAIMSLVFFGGFRGIGVGTVVTALINGVLIGKFSKLLEKKFSFEDSTGLRKYLGEKNK